MGGAKGSKKRVVIACLFLMTHLSRAEELPEWQEAFSEGVLAFEKGDFQKAVNRLQVSKQKVERLLPAITFNLANAYAYAGQTAQAISEFQELQKSWPSFSSLAEFMIAGIYIKKQKYEQAFLANETALRKLEHSKLRQDLIDQQNEILKHLDPSGFEAMLKADTSYVAAPLEECQKIVQLNGWIRKSVRWQRFRLACYLDVEELTSALEAIDTLGKIDVFDVNLYFIALSLYRRTRNYVFHLDRVQFVLNRIEDPTEKASLLELLVELQMRRAVVQIFFSEGIDTNSDAIKQADFFSETKNATIVDFSSFNVVNYGLYFKQLWDFNSYDYTLLPYFTFDADVPHMRVIFNTSLWIENSTFQSGIQRINLQFPNYFGTFEVGAMFEIAPGWGDVNHGVSGSLGWFRRFSILNLASIRPQAIIRLLNYIEPYIPEVDRIAASQLRLILGADMLIPISDWNVIFATFMHLAAYTKDTVLQFDEGEYIVERRDGQINFNVTLQKPIRSNLFLSWSNTVRLNRSNLNVSRFNKNYDQWESSIQLHFWL